MKFTRAYLLDGPFAGKIYNVDGPRLRIPMPLGLRQAWLGPEALPPAAPVLLAMAEYEIRQVEDPRVLHLGSDVTAVGRFVPPSLPCQHSRDRGPFSAFVLNREEALATMKLPEYRGFYPERCRSCGLVLQLVSRIPVGQWAAYKRELLMDLAESIAYLFREESE